MRIHCNAGSRLTNLIGDLPGYGTVWYDPKAIANILSLRQVRDRYHISYDSSHRRFIVTKPSGKEFVFQESEGGLHYLDTMQQQNHRQQGHVFSVNTVRDNKKNFTNNDYLRAVRARELQVMVGRPLDKDFIKILMIQFPPEMDENWVRYGLAKLGQISRTKLAEDAVLCVHNTASALNR